MDNKNLYYIWLSSSLRAGSKSPKILLEHFGDIEKIYNAEKQDYISLGIPTEEAVILCNKRLENATKYLEYCQSHRIGILTYDNPSYPERLKIISNPPAMFYYKGRLNSLDDYPCIAMVGTRSCSERGFRFAYEVAFDASSKGAVIVNGLASGIDAACLSGALDANGYAIGLLGCGIDRIYPYENKEIFERLEASGLILSEFAPFSKPEGYHFPIRNRVMSALSLATAVFEAGNGSGASYTAKHALEQGRRIFAVPAKPYDKSYSVALELIKDGATVFTEADDILTEYSMSFPHRINLANINPVSSDKLAALVSKYFGKDVNPDQPINRRHGRKKQEENVNVQENKNTVEKAPFLNETTTLPAEPEKETNNVSNSPDLSLLSKAELCIYNAIKDSGPLTPDEISEKGIKIDDILSALTLLEIYGLVKANPGGKYSIIK